MLKQSLAHNTSISHGFQGGSWRYPMSTTVVFMSGGIQWSYRGPREFHMEEVPSTPSLASQTVSYIVILIC